MITYEIRVHDYACGVTSVSIRSFMMAMRFFEAISVSEFGIYRKEFISHEWDKRIQIVLRDEEYV